MIVDHDERIGGVRDHWLKDFSWVGERLIDGALTNRTDLNEVLFGQPRISPRCSAESNASEPYVAKRSSTEEQ